MLLSSFATDMQIHQGLNRLPDFQNTIITIGSFDGVHLGHLMLINSMLEAEKELGETSILITFDPHPQQILQKQSNPISLLTTLEEKCELLKRTELQHLVIAPFNKKFSEINAEQYVSDFLVSHFHPSTIIIGHDHRFGKDRKGDIHLLNNLASKFQYQIQQIPAYLIDSISISSTRIRKELSDGNISVANELLGYHYFFSGKVTKGNQIGRTIGFPTANINVDAYKLIPGDGVYAVKVQLPETDQSFSGMMNIGMRPTVGGKTKTVEVHIFDFDADIYDKSITVKIFEKIRDEQKFDGLESLKTALQNDYTKAVDILSRF